MKRYFRLVLLIFLLPCAIAAQPKRPSNISDGFVLQFNPPFNRILIDTDEDNMPNRMASEIPVTPQTKILNHKGRTIAANEIFPGMQVEIKLDANLSALQLKVRTNPENWEIEVDGYLDKISDEQAFVDGQVVRLAPGAALVGVKEWKGKTFKALGEIPPGSLLDVKGARQTSGIVLIRQGEVKPNKFKVNEEALIKAVQAGLVLPADGQTGAAVKIGERTYTLSQSLELNGYVNKVGNRVTPRYLRNLPTDDPNKILFRFYVIEDDTPNAFALPDGSVFVYTGLLKRLANEAQLAMVIGHEIAHVTNEHSRRTLETAQKQAMWLSLAGAAGGQLGMLVAQVGYGLLQNKFSRELEDQADRVGLYYAWEADYDVREAPRMWQKMMGEFGAGKTGSILYADHPSMLSRYRNTNRMMVFNYARSDFSESEVGLERYMKVVGKHFGWESLPTLKRRQPETTAETSAGGGPATASTAAKTPSTADRRPPVVKKPTVKKPTVKKPTVKTPTVKTPRTALPVRDKISSVISFVVKEVNKPGHHSKGDIYISIAFEGFEYVVAMKTGRIIKKTVNPIKSFAEDYAYISVDLMNIKMQPTAQGGGWLLKQSGNTWTIVAIAEGDLSCNDLRAVPQTVRQKLNLVCF